MASRSLRRVGGQMHNNGNKPQATTTHLAHIRIHRPPKRIPGSVRPNNRRRTAFEADRPHASCRPRFPTRPPSVISILNHVLHTRLTNARKRNWTIRRLVYLSACLCLACSASISYIIR
ncbi:hypothetical protein BCR34DRAFT_300638 [Clohesyomyces aquaticus]|uniref:Uncharacterized protein n=1 Tax=Clohesyomyces aquaticus TaxID=1231657 RepID=A0A1Y1ZQA3_9PLEO|nr:hypothetical protein BCR34DRAFT_300638 [Clohesyomyces aquaticus]